MPIAPMEWYMYDHRVRNLSRISPSRERAFCEALKALASLESDPLVRRAARAALLRRRNRVVTERVRQFRRLWRRVKVRFFGPCWIGHAS